MYSPGFGLTGNVRFGSKADTRSMSAFGHKRSFAAVRQCLPFSTAIRSHIRGGTDRSENQSRTTSTSPYRNGSSPCFVVLVDYTQCRLCHVAGHRQPATGPPGSYRDRNHTGQATAIGDGRLAYELNGSWDDGTRSIALTKREFLERLAAQVPRPREHLIRYAGVFAPTHSSCKINAA